MDAPRSSERLNISSNRKSACQPSLTETGANARSHHPTGPRVRAQWLTSKIMPPGFTTRRNSASSACGSGTTDATNIATAMSNWLSRKQCILRIHLQQCFDRREMQSRNPVARPKQHLGGDINSRHALRRIVKRKRQPRANPHFQNAHTRQTIDRRYGRHARGPQNGAKRNIINIRQTRVGATNHRHVRTAVDLSL